MRLWNLGILAAGLMHVTTATAWAGSSINTLGSEDLVAISGYDTVALHTQKKGVKGRPEFVHEWMGAKWVFSSQGHLDLFKADPEKYAPLYGGNCALGVSDGYVSKKPFNGDFEVYRGKLYLFPTAGAQNTWWRTGGGPHWRIRSADQNWSRLKESLEER